MTMNVQISAVTLGVKDINRAKKFYSDGLGCAIDQHHPGFVSFKLGDGSTKLGLYAWVALAADAGVPADGSGFRAVTLKFIVESEARVAEAIALAVKAWATMGKPGHQA